MYIQKTYQDYEQASDKLAFLLQTLQEYKNSKEYKQACTGERYFNGDTDINYAKAKTILVNDDIWNEEYETYERKNHEIEIKNNRIASSFIERFVIQATQYLMNNGLELAKEKKELLGRRFDNVLQKAMEKASVHGECVLFWNFDHLEYFPVANYDERRGMYFLLDEQSGKLRIGVRFWQIDDKKPLYFNVYTDDGIFLYKKSKNGNTAELLGQEAYIKRTVQDGLGRRDESIAINRLPFTILKYNELGKGILTGNVKAKIDMYDRILSDFGDNMERMEGIYWAIRNFSGTTESARCFIADIEKYKMAIAQDESSFDPKAIEAPFNARAFALNVLEMSLYKDTMSLNLSEITGGSLTNVAIETAKTNLDLKCNRLEYQIFEALEDLLDIIGLSNLILEISNYERQTLTNKSELLKDIYIARGDITRKKALELNPYIDNDEVEEILLDMDKEDMGMLEHGQGD